jgi:hypothetical protein
MKWETDLIKDIRSNTVHDDTEAGINHFLHIWPEIGNDPCVLNPFDGTECSECNKEALLQQFLKVRDNCKSILEIGIGRNGENSFAHVFFKNKKEETKYIGIDIEDRSWLVDYGENIYTIQGSSSNYDENVEIANHYKCCEEYVIGKCSYITKSINVTDDNIDASHNIIDPNKNILEVKCNNKCWHK